MSRLAQICSAIIDRPWAWIGYVLVAVYVALLYHLGLEVELLIIAAIALVDRIFLSRIRRRRAGTDLEEIGIIEMEIPVGSATRSMKFLIGTLILFSVLWVVLLCREVVTIVASHFQDVGDLRLFLEQTLIMAALTASTYSNFRNQWWSLLITDQGLFQTVDTDRAWPRDRALDKSSSSRRAVFQRYPWGQIVRFHWSQQSGNHVLHLHVHQSGFGVPQLVSFPLPSLSEEDWQKLDHHLRTHLPAMPSRESDRTLTASAAVS
jgi:hypothetical protein